MNNIVFLMLLLISINSFSQLSNDSKNKQTRYIGKKPNGVCFENSVDRYRIKKKHTVSDLMNYFQLRPLWCPECSIDTAQSINNLKDVDTVLPGQILTIPQKCENFSWKDDFKYNKYSAKNINLNSDSDATEIWARRNNLSAQKSIITNDQSPLIPSQQLQTQNESVPILNSNNVTEKKISKKEYQKTNQKIGAEPFALFTENKANSNTLIATLRSDLSAGLRLSYEKTISNDNKIYGFGTVYNTEIKDDRNQFIILTPKKVMFGAGIGYKYYSNYLFSISAQATFKDDIYLDQASTTAISVEKSMNTLISIRPEYSFYQKNKWNILGHFDVGALLPASTFGGTTDMGYQAEIGLGTNYKMNWGKLFAGLSFGGRDQKNATYNFQEKYLNYKTGLSYLF